MDGELRAGMVDVGVRGLGVVLPLRKLFTTAAGTFKDRSLGGSYVINDTEKKGARRITYVDMYPRFIAVCGVCVR